MCIDFRKLNKATKKDHYPLLFIDQMLERLSKNTHFCFLDGYSCFLILRLDTRTRRKQLLHVLMELMLIDACHLVYVMHLLIFKDACLPFFMAFVRKLLKYSWTISPSMGLLLIIAYTILIKFCRDVKKQTSFLIGRSVILWLMKV